MSDPLPVPIASGGRVSTITQLATIPEEEIWLAKQKSARTRRAYRLDARHFMATLQISSIDELRQADHKAVIAWERYMREVQELAQLIQSTKIVSKTISIKQNSTLEAGTLEVWISQ
jgi:hypothetical protein